MKSGLLALISVGGLFLAAPASARDLAVELFKETKHSSELIMGTLLAQAESWDDALPYLETATANPSSPALLRKVPSR